MLAGIYVLFVFLSDTQTLFSKTAERRAAKTQNYMGGLALGLTRKIHSAISPNTSLNFTAVKHCEIWPRFFTPVAFDALWF